MNVRCCSCKDNVLDGAVKEGQTGGLVMILVADGWEFAPPVKGSGKKVKNACRTRTESLWILLPFCAVAIDLLDTQRLLSLSKGCSQLFVDFGELYDHIIGIFGVS